MEEFWRRRSLLPAVTGHGGDPGDGSRPTTGHNGASSCDTDSTAQVMANHCLGTRVDLVPAGDANAGTTASSGGSRGMQVPGTLLVSPLFSPSPPSPMTPA